jgi:hypothetical protein
VARLAPAREAATATYFGIPDGHTLNLQALLPPSSYDPASPDPASQKPASAQVVFRRAGAEHWAPATLRSGHGGEWYAESTVLLGARPGGVPLGRGAWQLRVVVTTATGEEHRLPLRRPLPEPQRDGPTVAAPACADTGARYRPVVSSLGVCRIVVTRGRPGAEVVRLEIHPGRAEISGRFVGVGDATGAVAEFYRTGDDILRDSPVTVAGDVFRIGLPLAALVPAPGAEEIWEIRLRLPGGRRLQVGRFLHDLRHIRRTLRPYERPVLVPGGALFHLRLQYTLAGRLNLICTSSDTGEHA